jgi:anti-sigma factor RsiW
MVGQILNTLDAQEARQLRAHLETCEGCRRYLAEMSHVTERLAAVKINPDIQASESFHRNVAQKLRAAKRDSLGGILRAYIQGRAPHWRVAVPVVAALALIGVILVAWPQPPKNAAGRSAAPAVTLVSRPDNDLAPTIANYQRTANQSLEKLDALLTCQNKQASPALPSYTAATPRLANEPF